MSSRLIVSIGAAVSVSTRLMLVPVTLTRMSCAVAGLVASNATPPRPIAAATCVRLNFMLVRSGWEGENGARREMDPGFVALDAPTLPGRRARSSKALLERVARADVELRAHRTGERVVVVEVVRSVTRLAVERRHRIEDVDHRAEDLPVLE